MVVVGLFNPSGRADVCFARSSDQAQEDAVVPLAVQLACARLLARQFPKYMLSEHRCDRLSLMACDELVGGPPVRLNNIPIKNRIRPSRTPLP